MLKKAVCLLLSVIFLAACTVPAFAAETDELPPADSGLTLEGMLAAYQSRDMEQLQVYFDALGVNDEEEQPTIAPRWASGGFPVKEKLMTHQQLTAYGFLMYVSAMQSLFGRQLNAMGYTFEDLQTLVECSPKPDHFIMTYLTLYEGHFYDPATGLNYHDRNTNTAKTNTIDYYQQAVSNFINGKRKSAIEQLGYALHFLEDANQPHHAANISATQEGNRHSEFENYANADLLNEFIESGTYEFNPELSFYSDYLSRSIGDSVHVAATSAKIWIGCAQSTNESLMRICALFTFANTMSHVSGLLYRFAKDTHMI